MTSREKDASILLDILNPLAHLLELRLRRDDESDTRRPSAFEPMVFTFGSFRSRKSSLRPHGSALSASVTQ
jgi:hypothetical protein